MLAAAVHEAVENPEVRQRMTSIGIEPVGNTPEEFAKFLQGQVARWSTLVKNNNITLE
jgi:tripartite-type tricarboxylate transporter receptor subunit TctC